MGKLLRRRAMMQMAAGPLYPFPTITSGRLAGTGGNIVEYTYTTSGTRYIRPYKNRSISNTSGENGGAKVFTIPAGATVVTTLTIVERAGSTAINANYAWFIEANSTTRHGIGEFTIMSSVGATRTCTKTFETATDVGDLMIGLGSATGITIEVSVFVDGVQYI